MSEREQVGTTNTGPRPHRETGALAAGPREPWWTHDEFDILVIGGGINGACIARDAAMRGLKTLIVEKRDWGWATSAKSSRLAHGGLRYLEQFEFGLVHEALQDRERLLRQAPHLVRPLEFLYPLYPEIASRRTVRVGLMLYDVLSHGRSVPGHKKLSKSRALEKVPSLNPDGLKGGATYWDAQIDHVERLCIENIADAVRHGAYAQNYAAVEELLIDGGHCIGARIHFAGQEHVVKAKMTVNATGTWVDQTLGALQEGKPPKVRKTLGIHIAVPRFLDTALIIRSATDGRTFFVLPWRDTCYIGTTDTDYEGDAGDAKASARDVAYLIESASAYVPDAPLDKILYTWAGVRALVNQEGLTESNVTRRHIIYDHAKDGVVGLMSLQGGKITTARSLGEEVVSQTCKFLGNKKLAKQRPTRNALLPGGTAIAWPSFVETALEAGKQMGLTETCTRTLLDTYGARWRQVVESTDSATKTKPLAKGSGHIEAEVYWAVQQEMAQSVEDFMLRRTALGMSKNFGQSAAVRVANIMAKILDWSKIDVQRQLASYRATCTVLAVPADSPPAALRPEAPLESLADL